MKACQKRKKVMLFGAGVVGSHLIDLFARGDDEFDLTVVARNGVTLPERVNLAIAVAMNLGYSPAVHHAPMDVTDTSLIAELISKIQPEIVINATSVQSFWVISTLPQKYYNILREAEIGPWLPNHLSLAKKVMEAVKMSGCRPWVINVSFPDAVNSILTKVKLGPDVGAGNVGNSIPTLRRAIALATGLDLRSIEVKFVAHHYVGNRIATFGDPGSAPYHLSASSWGEDISHLLSEVEIFKSFTSHLKRTRGIQGQIMAASSAASVAKSIARQDGTLIHVPGPLGLVGGYPVRIIGGSIRLDLPNSLNIERAIEINELAQINEGISKIDDDGTVHFCSRQMDVLRRTIGYECNTMKLSDVDQWASELADRYHRFKQNIGIQ